MRASVARKPFRRTEFPSTKMASIDQQEQQEEQKSLGNLEITALSTNEKTPLSTLMQDKSLLVIHVRATFHLPLTFTSPISAVIPPMGLTIMP